MSDTKPFVHLHCHTHFSLLDGANKIPDLVAHTKSMGMNACAITDHGNLYGAMEFYTTCLNEGIKPIIGYEAYIAPGRRTDRSASRMKEASFHLTLLAMNEQGFRNLVKMASVAYLEGFYYKPRIDKDLLAEHQEGLICLSGCASSELSHFILGENMDRAKETIQWFDKVFGDRFYLEIQNSDLEIQRQCLEGTVDLAQQVGIPLVATNDSHYLCQEDAAAHDVLLCVNTRTVRSDEKRMRMDNDQFFVRSPEQMYQAFPGLEHAVSRSQEIADRVDIQLDLNAKHYPVFRPPAGKTDTEYLRELCEQRLTWRYGEDGITDAHRERLDYELGVIEQMGYSSYFLIVWDFVRFAEEHKIPCSARGSACGAIVAFLLGFSHVCPLKYDLLFERFLDPSRSEPPDIDIDFCRDRRQMVIDYTKEKYGIENVAQIGTFGTLKAKMVVRDVGRALGVPLARVNEIAKMVPDTLNIKLKTAVEETAELQNAYETDSQVKELIDIAYRLEGLARSAGTHAAGVVVADEPISQFIPLQRITGKEDIITQWDGPTVEMAGLLKMDFLGLRNLTILDKAVHNVQKYAGIEIDPLKLPLDDKETFALLQRGETKGIFQLESGGMRDLLTKMKPDRFEDIIATSALYRPGPLEGGMVMEYVNVKHGRQEPRKIHPVVDAVLAETNGVMVYQEQVMRILNRVGDIELPAAYRCIKAISKKKLKTIADFREQYVTGAQKNGIPVEVATDLFELIEKFAGYGFNKSHSTAYGAVAYQTAYLKAHYPREFMAALLSCGMEDSNRIAEHVDDCRRMKIEVLPPDVNSSEAEFAVVGEKLSFGMAAIKGLGGNVVDAIVAERLANGPFKDIFDLAERIDPKILNKSALEVLNRAGALDSLGPNREQHLQAIERAVQASAAKVRDKAAGQKSLFGDDGDSGNEEEMENLQLPEALDWSHSQKLAYEREVLGFYLTSHPLTEHAATLEQFSTHNTAELVELEDKDEVTLAGLVSSIKKASTKKPSRNGNTQYINFDFEDSHGVVRCIMWPEEFARLGHMVEPDAIRFVKGRVDRRSREPNIIVDSIMSLEEAEKNFTDRLAVKFSSSLHDASDMRRVRTVLSRHPGNAEVILLADTPDDSAADRSYRFILAAPESLRVACTRELREELTQAIGPTHFKFHAVPVKRNGPARHTGR